MADRPTTEDTPIAKTLKPRHAPEPEPTPEPEGRASRMVHNIMDKASNVTTGGAKSVVEGALKHF